MLHLLIPCLLAIEPAAAFSIQPASSGRVHATQLGASNPLGDFVSGITGMAPSSLDPPSDLLAGTSIDPARNDVDLGRVYKVGYQDLSGIE